MSTLSGKRGQLRGIEEHDEPISPIRLGLVGMVLILLFGAVLAASEFQLLPSYSADDVASIVFGAG